MRNVSGTYTFTENTNIRTAPSLSAPVVGTYYPGDSVTYTGQVNAEGYIWLQYLSGSGNTRYVAMSAPQHNTIPTIFRVLLPLLNKPTSELHRQRQRQ